MDELQRLTYYPEDGMANDDNGEFVHYDEAMAVINQLHAQIDALQAEIAKLHGPPLRYGYIGMASKADETESPTERTFYQAVRKSVDESDSAAA